jgi:hypothetical protein
MLFVSKRENPYKRKKTMKRIGSIQRVTVKSFVVKKLITSINRLDKRIGIKTFFFTE